MMVLTVHQPEATMLVHGYKRMDAQRVGTRYRGPVAIYAAWSLRGMGHKGFLRYCLDAPFRTPLYTDLKIGTCRSLPRGAVVGVADLVDVEPLGLHDEPPAYPENAMGGYGPDCQIFHLDSPRPFAVPLKLPLRTGKNGLWLPSGPFREELLRRL